MSSQIYSQLNNRLSQRPARKSLIDNNIYKLGGNIAAKRLELEKQQKQDYLNKKISNRSEPPVTNVAPRLQGVTKALERQMVTDKVGHLLDQRSSVNDLSNQGVLQNQSVAPRLQGVTRTLEKAINKDRVNHLIETRVPKEVLQNANILPTTSTAPSLQGIQRTLERQMVTDKVGHLLEQRHTIDELTNQGVLQDQTIAPSIQGVQNQLKTNLAKSNLYHGLKHRPSIHELQDKGIIQDNNNDDDITSDYVLLDDKDTTNDTAVNPSISFQRRSRNFHLTRILLKFVAILAQQGHINLKQKGEIKDLIVDQDPTILDIASEYDQNEDVNTFAQKLIDLTITKSLYLILKKKKKMIK